MFQNASTETLPGEPAQAATPAAPDGAVPPAAKPDAPARRGTPQPVSLGTAGLKSSYANFANANATREEVVLSFGLNQDWDRARAALHIELEHRVVMSPFAAKRFARLLDRLVREYEDRYGELKLP